ncbi:MAG TPA: type II secretion system protein [Candidatus Saccharimonadales bacterium]|nr:type II secretion system protein [Candidatus Saccharimonadales bacterium]
MKQFFSNTYFQKGQSLVELLVAIGISTILLPALLTGLYTTNNSKAQADQRTQAQTLLKETDEAVRSVRESGWSAFSTNGTFHPVVTGSAWSLATGTATINGLTQSIIITDVQRDTSGVIVTSGGTVDPSTKQVVTTVSWVLPYPSSIQNTLYLSRYLNNISYSQTTLADFNAGTLPTTQVQTANTSGGEVILANDNRAKWCSPSFSSATIDLPDGPPVAVAATASATSTSIPNDAFVATAPNDSSSIKLAYVTVTANTATPSPTLKGTFTLDPAQYSSSNYVPSGLGITNNFKTNDVKYYTSTGGNLYALLATDLSDHEVIAVKIKNNGSDIYQDPLNHIYPYWTFFNTHIFGNAFNSPTANAAVTGGDGDGFQTNPTSAYVQDGSYASDTNSGSGTGTNCTGSDKDKHVFYNYGFTIPSGATVNGIAVNLNAKVDSTTGSPKMCVQISWDGGTTWTTTQSTNTLSTTAATYTLGGSSDTWGRTWSDTDFNNANFRMRIIDVASSTSRDFSLDFAGVKIYYNGISTIPNDQAPFGYGATALNILGNTGYVDSGGYLYTFDLSNIDSKSPTNELDQIGCRILLEGYDCQPGTPNGSVKKYGAGETGTSWSDASTPSHNTCSDGGNIELYADHQLSAVQVGTNKYVYVSVGAVPASELDIVDVSTPPSSNLSTASCGRGSDTGWKVTGNLDFDPANGTEEAANSVYAKPDGTRAYMSSNGGIINNGISDSDQFYIIDTTNKSSPKFLSTWPSTITGQHYQNTAESGYYNATTSADLELYPRRALTVLNGGANGSEPRAILVGQDGIPNDGVEPHEYQVLNLDSESTPYLCGALNFSSGFNDLTSVSQANGDNYVYMVANTNEKQLKIIQGGPDTGIYVSSGMFTSSIYNLGSQTAVNRFMATVNQPANTAIKMQIAVAPVGSDGTCNTASYLYVGPDGTSNTFFTPNGSTISSAIPTSTSGTYQNPGRCLRYQATLSTTDTNITPKLYDVTFNYSP